MQQKAALVFGDPEALNPWAVHVPTSGSALHDGELAGLLRDESLGEFSPPPETLDWLVDLLECERPRRVLEFGSGVTTFCMAVALRRIAGPNDFRLLSFDQDPEYAAHTRARLESLGVEDACRVVHAPLRSQMIEGDATDVYDLSGAQRDLDWLGAAQIVFVDGPFAEGPCRYGGLAAVRSRLSPDARFILDDAYREKELLTGLLWDKLDGVRVEGVLTIGEGLLVGRVA